VDRARTHEWSPKAFSQSVVTPGRHRARLIHEPHALNKQVLTFLTVPGSVDL